MLPRVAAIIGPTAAGKSSLAVQVAERLNAEIVSVDSMQLYRSMDAGTDKPTTEMRRRVPHHLVDVCDPREIVSVKRFQAMARACIADISRRGGVPLLVGGSGLYWRAVVDDLDFPPHSPALRAALEKEAAERGAEELYARLQAQDAAAASRIAPTNVRRIIRALEVIALTGRKFSAQSAWGRHESRFHLVVAGVTRQRAELFARIERRVEDMLDRGLMAEAERLQVSGLGTTAQQALGYRQVLDAPPGASREEVASAIIAATKRFARRQESWFRADPRVTWFDAADASVVDDLVAHFKSRLGLQGRNETTGAAS